jgi:creatinine amidohydrolase
MRTVRFECLKPDEILAEQNRKSIVYLAFGPLEWHGPHLPFGTDPLAAYAMALRAAEQTGGVVMPPLYCGTERERTPELLEAFGLENTNAYVVGMDLPAVTVPSLYFKEDTFGMILREHIRLLVRRNYRLIVLLNGHGAAGQVETVKRLAVEFSNESASRVIDLFSILPQKETGVDPGHATLLETAVQMYLEAENVDMSLLPSREIPLKYRDYGIADDAMFKLKPGKEKTVEFDPRDAVPALGEKLFKAALAHVCNTVEKEYDKIANV